MPKRKFSETEDSLDQLPEAVLNKARRQRKRVGRTIDNSKIVLTKALSSARISERQKLGRRQKDAHQENKSLDLARIDKEIEALRHLDFSVLAESYLYKTLARIKSIASSPALPTYVKRKAEASKKVEDAAHSNVVSRLCSSAPVKTAMKDIVDNIRAALVIHTDVFEENSGKDFQESVDIKSSKPHDQITSPGSVDSDTESSDDGEMDLDIKSLASSESSSSSPNTPRTVVRSSRKQPQLPLKSTTFLPSLAQGGYLSGSDSNASDLEDDLTASKPRKNRRGQQERRIIWERKYGDKANHKKNPKQGRNEGWDPRKGAQLDGQRSNSRFKERGRSKVDREKHQTSRASGANSAPVNRKENLKKVDAGPIHPSWEAARKLKEQKNTTAFTGKKLVFD